MDETGLALIYQQQLIAQHKQKRKQQRCDKKLRDKEVKLRI
jgi:hypothetical protein